MELSYAVSSVAGLGAGIAAGVQVSAVWGGMGSGLGLLTAWLTIVVVLLPLAGLMSVTDEQKGALGHEKLANAAAFLFFVCIAALPFASGLAAYVVVGWLAWA